jgi:L-fucose isomerase-like protein
MKKHVKIGVVCLVRKTFDYKAAEDIYKRIQDDLNRIENATFEFIHETVIEVEDAKKAGEELKQKLVDGLICISGTFHLGHLILEINKILQKPILLWGLNELPYDGGKIRLNSVCGVNLNASNLYKAGVRNYHAVIGDDVDEDWIDALRIMKTFATSHIGIAGFRAKGFFNLGVYDLNVYKELGVLIDHYELNEIFDCQITEEDFESRKSEVKSTFDVSGISEDQLNKVSSLSAKLNSFLDENHIDALAIRCWPEFASKYGISPCAAMSLLQSEHRLIACEGDVEGALSMLAHSAVGAETPFLFDFSQVNLQEDYALFWHCGVAPCNLWDKKCNMSLDTYFAGGKGVTADFVLKEGDLSILRIDSAGTEYRLFLQEAKSIPMEKLLKGTYMKVVFDEPVKDVLFRLIENGVAHHSSVVYGKYIRPFEILAKIKGWKVIK